MAVINKFKTSVEIWGALSAEPIFGSRRIQDTEAGYYADGEDAYDMRLYLKPRKTKGDGGPSKGVSKSAAGSSAS